MQTRRGVLQSAAALAAVSGVQTATAAKLGNDTDPVGTYWIGRAKEDLAESIGRTEFGGMELENNEFATTKIGLTSKPDLKIYEGYIEPLDGNGTGSIKLSVAGNTIVSGSSKNTGNPIATISSSGLKTVELLNDGSGQVKSPYAILVYRREF